MRSSSRSRGWSICAVTPLVLGVEDDAIDPVFVGVGVENLGVVAGAEQVLVGTERRRLDRHVGPAGVLLDPVLRPREQPVGVVAVPIALGTVVVVGHRDDEMTLERVGRLETGLDGVADRLSNGHRVRQRNEQAFNRHDVSLLTTVVGHS